MTTVLRPTLRQIRPGKTTAVQYLQGQTRYHPGSGGYVWQGEERGSMTDRTGCDGVTARTDNYRNQTAYTQTWYEDREERRALQREKHDAARELRRGNLPLEEWVNRTAEGTYDPYAYLDRDIEEREAINDLLGRRE